MSDQVAKKRSIRKRILPAVFRRVRKIGIGIVPFVTVREGEGPTNYENTNAALSFGFLAVDDIDELARLEPGVERDMLCNWFSEGKLCFGVRDGSAIVAKMWCDLNEFNFPPSFRKLAADEAYLFAAYAHPDYRGQNLAPFMREACYATLREMGRDRFYSYTDYYNATARRFKEKLGARNEALRLYIDLFGFMVIRASPLLRSIPTCADNPGG